MNHSFESLGLLLEYIPGREVWVKMMSNGCWSLSLRPIEGAKRAPANGSGRARAFAAMVQD